MLAAIGALAQHFVVFPGWENTPRGMGALLDFNGLFGLSSLLSVVYYMETAFWKQDPNKEVGDFGDPLDLGMYDKDMRNKEINNGRFAMIAIMGIILAENETGMDAVEQVFGI